MHGNTLLDEWRIRQFRSHGFVASDNVHEVDGVTSVVAWMTIDTFLSMMSFDEILDAYSSYAPEKQWERKKAAFKANDGAFD